MSTISKNAEFQEAIVNYRDYTEQIRKLDEEMDTHPDADLLHEIMSRAEAKSRDPIDEMIKALEGFPIFGPMLASILKVVRIVSQSLVEVVGIAFKS